MTVRLRPLVYVTRPRWWHVDVVGCAPQEGNTSVGRFELRVEDAERFTGYDGVELAGAVRRLKVPGPVRSSMVLSR